MPRLLPRSPHSIWKNGAGNIGPGSQSRRNIRLLTWFNFCDDFRIYNAVAVVYFAQITHSYALAGLVFHFLVAPGVVSDLEEAEA